MKPILLSKSINYYTMTTDDDLRNELAVMQMKANQITDKSLEITEQLVALTQETQDIGIGIVGSLEEQGEQLDNIEQDLDKINKDVKEAEKKLQELQKCCGFCVCPWNRIKNFENTEDYKETWNIEKDGKVINKQPGVVKVQNVREMEQVPGGYVKRVTNDDRESEMESNLAQISGAISNLKFIADDMSNKIITQNEQIDRINEKTESNNAELTQVSATASKILRS